ncbi:MAG TPA: aminoglycoside phosphotransferase family protein [Steroidobacteraceae bacterium]|jgi:aminoglycoside phosphotransferase (APT) family kinase protein|nr:aminoglycoside phosphotransferase family protein [Steroidobacteraceae bacterium]
MVEITSQLVSALLAAQFPQWARLPLIPVEPGGWDNRTFRLGDAMAVRLPSAECYAEQVDKEQRWLPWLAPQLPLAVPSPLAVGEPGAEYPWHWSIYRWIDGETVATSSNVDLAVLASDLARFLVELQSLDATQGPVPGAHNFQRGGSLSIYDQQTRRAIAALGREIDAARATEIWDEALATSWDRAPVWIHGDVAAGNLLLQDAKLHAVIDFGCCAVGDPACDLVAAWTIFDADSADDFRKRLQLDDATWQRARGWALWKALITLVDELAADATAADRTRALIERIISA